MSAIVLKHATEHRVGQAIEAVREELETRNQDDLAQLRYNQGRAAGMREALGLMHDAYKHLGD